MNQFTFLTALVLTLVAAVPTGAQDNAKDLYTAGVVLAVSPSRGTLTVVEAGLEANRMTFAIQSSTLLQKGQRETEAITLSDIEVGDPVSVEYQMSGRTAIAESCRLLTAPAS
jgi:hypothetical protein